MSSHDIHNDIHLYDSQFESDYDSVSSSQDTYESSFIDDSGQISILSNESELIDTDIESE